MSYYCKIFGNFIFSESSASGNWGKTDRDKYFVTAIVTLDLMKLFLEKQNKELGNYNPHLYTTTTYLELSQVGKLNNFSLNNELMIIILMFVYC